jgi:hypothetical protein
MSASAAQIGASLALQYSPVILTNGIATQIGGYLPIIALTEGAGLLGSVLTGSGAVTQLLEGAAIVGSLLNGGLPSLQNLFASYIVLPGGTMISNQVGMYPFANQAVAANAIIAQPLQISVMMRVPATASHGFAVKLATMTALQSSLQQHSFSGGTYSVISPSYIYTDCLLTAMEDVGEDDTQQQHSWRLDFVKPLVTISAAQQAQNSLMKQLTNGSKGLTALTSTPGLPTSNPALPVF